MVMHTVHARLHRRRRAAGWDGRGVGGLRDITFPRFPAF